MALRIFLINNRILIHRVW